MKSAEIFYNEQKAKDFMATLTWEDAEPEMVHTEEYDDDNGTVEACFVVYFNPPRMK
jgi:hypothetical protein